MTHFRFRYKRVGFMRWRCRSARRQAVVLLLPLACAAPQVLSAAAWRRTLPVAVVPPVPAAKLLRVGEFVVGEEGDPQLLGHPDIRY